MPLTPDFKGFLKWLGVLGSRLVPARRRAGVNRRCSPEALEPRILLATYEVLNTFNAGAGSLRQAILDANANSGKDAIVFKFLSGFENLYEKPVTQNLDMNAFGTTSVIFPERVAVIRPSTSLPIITDAVVINGLRSRAFSQQPVPGIEIRGDLTARQSGLRIQSSGTEIRGLIINSFEFGIRVLSGSNSIIEDNYIGVHWSDGTKGNKVGVNAEGVNSNTIRDNIFADNISFSVQLKNSNNNTLQGNTISGGTAGELVAINGSDGNLIGGSTSSQMNTFAGGFVGINVSGSSLSGSDSNAIQGNDISSGFAGIWIHGGSNNLVGGSSLSSANVVAGAFEGIVISGPQTTNNTIRRNYLGVARGGNVTGKMWGNYVTGIHVYDAPANVIRDNIIGGLNPNEAARAEGGVPIATSRDAFAAVVIDGTSATGNQLLFNKIGIGADGVTPLINHGYGVYLLDHAANTRVEGNVISNSRRTDRPMGPAAGGIVVAGGPGTVIVGNFIGTTASGTAAAGNDQFGVLIQAGHVMLGGFTISSRNYISGNRGTGVVIAGTGAGNVTVQGNYIGVDKTGAKKLANDGDGILVSKASTNIKIGGPGPRGNTISGNIGTGVAIETTQTVTVQGNRIGTNSFGDKPIGNDGFGLALLKASNNLIGGADPFALNVISGNGAAGILIAGETGGDAKQNIIANNYIGVSILEQPLGNRQAGLMLINAASNIIGESVGNIIGHNYGPGIYLRESLTTSNRIIGNSLIRNSAVGIQAHLSSSNTIGGNSIIGNEEGGVEISGGRSNTLYGNRIENNGNFGVILNSTAQNRVGDTAQAENIITGHDVFGIYIVDSNSNTGANNQIVSNEVAGVGIAEGNNNSIVSSSIRNNGNGVLVETGTNNTVLGNQIYDNQFTAIDLLPVTPTANDSLDADGGPNGLQNTPIITEVTWTGGETRVVGRLESKPSTLYQIQFYQTDARHRYDLPQAQTLLGSMFIATDASGVANFDRVFNVASAPGNVITALATGAEGSSELSPPYNIPSPEFQIEAGILSDAIAVDRFGNSVVAAFDSENDSIVVARFDAQGLPRDLPLVLVADREGADEVAIGMDAAGNFVVAWVAFTGSPRVYARRFKADGTALDETPFTVDSLPGVYPNSNFATNVSVAMNSNGAFVIAFEGGDLYQEPKSDIYVRHYAANGTPLAASEFRVNQHTTDSQSDPRVAMDDSGNAVVVWREAAGGVVMKRRLSSNGTPLENERSVYLNGGNPNPGGMPDVAMNAVGDYVIVWKDGDYFDPGPGRFQRFSRTGIALDASPLTFADNVVHRPAVSMDARGNFATLWNGSDSDVHFRRYNSFGQSLAEAETANGITAGLQHNAHIAMADTGNFSITFLGPAGAYVRAFDYRPDIQLRSVTADGESQIQIVYEISGSVDEISVDVLQSRDEVPGAGDVLLTTLAITSPADLAPGVHTLSRDVGAEAGKIAMPGLGVAQVDFSHSILFVADRADLIGERDIDPLVEDNTTSLSGVLTGTNGAVSVYGTELADEISITPGSVKVRLNSEEFVYETAAVRSVRVFAGGGNDDVRMLASNLPLIAWGDDGDDLLIGGNSNDKLYGNSGDDLLFGGGGKNWIFDTQGTNEISLVNVPPVITGVMAAVVFDGASPNPALIAPHILVTDSDTEVFAGSVATIRSSDAKPHDVITILSSTPANGVKLQGTAIHFGGTQKIIGTLTMGAVPGSATIEFNSFATRAIVEAVLRRLSFAASPMNSPETVRHFTLTVTDGQSGTSTPVVLEVGVINVNDPPQILIPRSVTYFENDPAFILSPEAIVFDPDSATFEDGSLIIKNAVNWTATDSLRIRNEGGGDGQVSIIDDNVLFGGINIGTVSGGAGRLPLVVRFNQNATIEAVQAVARNVIFLSAGDNPSTATRELEWSVLDGDGGELIRHRQSVRVVARNDAPTNINLSSTQIPENRSIGSIIGIIGATDVDHGDTFRYTLVTGAGSTNNWRFRISANQLLSKVIFNFEAANSYSIRIKVTDKAGLAFEKVFLIRVSDVNEAPTSISLSSNRVSENKPAGTLVGLLNATDVDQSSTFSFTLVSGTGSADNSGFQVSGRQLTAKIRFNFEAKRSYSIRVKVTDNGGLTFEKVLLVLVTDVKE